MSIWKIENKTNGIFKIDNPQKIQDLYFPLTNSQGTIYSCISPFLSGDIKKTQHHFLTYPATVFDLKNPFCIRTLWLCFENKPALNISPFWPTKDNITFTAGPLWQRLTRINKKNNLKIETLNFVPQEQSCEIMQVKITNTAKTSKKITPLTSIPLFCRSEDNLRNHRHVSSLLNRTKINKQGIVVTPTMTFNERGHKKNNVSYYVYGLTDRDKTIDKAVSSLEEFIGPEGNLVFPQNIDKGIQTQGKNLAGKENIAAIQFKTYTIKPNSELNIFLIMGIDETEKVTATFKEFDSPAKIKTAFKKSKEAWTKYWNSFCIDTANTNFDFWMRWVNLQPTLRKLFGCSFLAHFDYGKGGRGWRDLWQDFLTDILTNPAKIKEILINNFKGVRIDGSNATIITETGKFLSDRDKISRVWTDHGIWPFLVLQAYIDRTNDYKILFQETSFFKDHQINRAKEKDKTFNQINNPECLLKDKNNKTYKSSILDHLFIENLVQFFNVGPRNNIRLENADWNDALDMAPDKGESVAFSCMYAENLKNLSEILEKIRCSNTNKKEIKITKELKILFDTLEKKIDYNSPNQKQKVLNKYFKKTKHKVEGKKINLPIDKLIEDIERKQKWLTNHIRKTEWLQNPGIFNGYYDNKSKRIDGKYNNKINIMLPSQTFPIISGVAQKEHIQKIWETICKKLRYDKYYAFKLNTDFNSLNLDLGRVFGFSYGDKENGSVFSHMNILTAYGLYKRGFVKEGYKIFSSLFKLSTETNSQIAPCIPEYFNLQGRGLYPYLTGSASWLIYLFTTQILGINFQAGKLTIKPKLVKEQFSQSTQITFSTLISENKLSLSFINERKKQWPHYKIEKLILNEKEIKPKKDHEINLSLTQTKKALAHPYSRLKIYLV